MSVMGAVTPVLPDWSPSKAWMRALELTSSIARNSERVMPVVVQELAEKYGDAAALVSDGESLTYSGLSGRANQYGRWALANGVRKGDVVALLMRNRPEYFAIWLGIAGVGGVVALLNTNLVGESLSHCLNTVAPMHVIVDEALAAPLLAVLPTLESTPALWSDGAEDAAFGNLADALHLIPSHNLTPDERRSVTVEDRALCIFTSGTTGMPKAANISHARVMQWTHWFAGMMGVQPTDRMYNCLPMYHSIGGVLVPGAMLVGGGSVVIRERFSASQFWIDIHRWDCTIFQYIGEFCRYLLQAPVTARSRQHRIRLACGNGLSAEVWEDLRQNFNIPRILEFYASTEGVLSLFNVEGHPGAIGRVPPYLAHRFAPVLVKVDVETGKLVRDEKGLCVRCAVDEPGEALGKMHDDPAGIGSRFDGYTDRRASEARILRDVFRAGDAWVRTGDLMRKDAKGFFYFVDRLGDTFRRKGENVSTLEVSEALCAFPGVQHAIVYGVAVPAVSGRVGMASIQAARDLDLAGLRRHLIKRLPAYARPVFLRITGSVEVTGTFKYSKTELVRQAFDPGTTQDSIYFDSPQWNQYILVNGPLFEQIDAGQVRI